MSKERQSASYFLQGLRDGVPIGLGYFAVAFGLGITAHNAGMTAFQGFVMSALNMASAGEYAGISAFATGATYAELAILILITNARYLLMSTALSQKFSPDTPFFHRFLIGADVTDELFGLAIAQPGYIRPSYMYGAFAVAIPGWSLGTALGIIAGDVLPTLAVVSLSAAIYGMFIAVIIPPGKKNRKVLIVVLVSFAASWLCSVLPVLKELSGSLRVIALTLVISSVVAVIAPVPEEEATN